MTGKLLVVQKIQKTWMKLENVGSFASFLVKVTSTKHRNDYCSVLDKDKVMLETLKDNSPTHGATCAWLSVREEEI